MFGKLFGKAKKVQNKNIMEAIVAGALLVAAADGEIGREEIEKLEKLLNANDLLEAFRGSELRKVMAKFTSVLEADFGVGRKKMLDEISDIADNADHAEEVILTMLAIAKADGEIEDTERKVLVDVCKVLRLNPSNFDL